MARYDVCVLWGIVKGRSFSEAAVKMTIDGKVAATHCSNITINQTQHVGKGLRVTPDARCAEICWHNAVCMPSRPLAAHTRALSPSLSTPPARVHSPPLFIQV